MSNDHVAHPDASVSGQIGLRLAMLEAGGIDGITHVRGLHEAALAIEAEIDRRTEDARIEHKSPTGGFMADTAGLMQMLDETGRLARLEFDSALSRQRIVSAEMPHANGKEALALIAQVRSEPWGQPQNLFSRVGLALWGDKWQTPMSNALGISKATINDWRQGRSSPRAGVWADLLTIARQRAAVLASVIAEIEAKKDEL
ncbi:hypothetical protein GCM10019059_07940 [Camelimonas fluminis]|uniref:Uncharacterized protein n=1 Tax=Camelimonas fluminis TaxID=1576911 RepID=A0ABV7UEC3_9HYPH|nr:hypothetical protein [Camelimonas fluminis]GHE51128.1 hypothetical protein GCM10019059_07940 [Camelimonas fluminis]